MSSVSTAFLKAESKLIAIASAIDCSAITNAVFSAFIASGLQLKEGNMNNYILLSDKIRKY